MQEITLDTKISTLLDIEGMKDILININPKFKKLNNPILRKTLAKVASVRQAAVVGNMNAVDLLNMIRAEFGQAPIEADEDNKTSSDIKQYDKSIKPAITIDANEMLDREKNPLSAVRSALKELNSKEWLVIIADFKPEPLIDEFHKSGYKIYVDNDRDIFKTYIQK